MEHPVVLMESFSRSGETVFQRTLEAHSRIHIVHDLKLKNTKEEVELYKFLRSFEAADIPADATVLAPFNLRPGTFLLFKNAVWLPRKRQSRSFVLVRNPFSVALSAGVVGESHQRAKANKRIILRWASGIAPELCAWINYTDNLTALLVLWNIKMSAAMAVRRPVLHYERFVSDPVLWSRRLLEALGLPWEPAVARAHERYASDAIGHGRIRLGEPIHAKSLDSYRRLSAAAFDRILALTYPVLHQCGYETHERVVRVSPDFPDGLSE